MPENWGPSEFVWSTNNDLELKLIMQNDCVESTYKYYPVYGYFVWYDTRYFDMIEDKN